MKSYLKVGDYVSFRWGTLLNDKSVQRLEYRGKVIFLSDDDQYAVVFLEDGTIKHRIPTSSLRIIGFKNYKYS